MAGDGLGYDCFWPSFDFQLEDNWFDAWDFYCETFPTHWDYWPEHEWQRPRWRRKRYQRRKAWKRS
ncbi:MAG: hypothetical protein KDB68_12860 [Planctomycetes bacterium]|nr:hypothetical protein [Planctomycetota bacterium]MCA8937082.1 hypothetical protein [Planctomycetota bacterium]